MIDVCLTVDTEFDIGGTFADPVRRRPVGEERVMCPNASGEHGLPFLLSVLERYGLRATFFVETAQVCFFGDRPMGLIVERILAAGHDVQLHLHPCWHYFRDPDWRNSLHKTAPCDDCDGRRVDELTTMINHGIETLRRWGTPSPNTFRAGSLRIDKAVYRAMEQCNLFTSSSVGLAVWPPSEASLKLKGGLHRFGDVLEVPVLTYREIGEGMWGRNRLFTISATSEKEAKILLRRAAAAESGPIVVLMHPFEFITGDLRFPQTVRPNKLTQRRFQRLCAFIASHGEHFRAVTFGDAAGRWRQEAPSRQPQLNVPLSAVMHRLIFS
jgi:peptidoglycan/xylan/chitin deacetylase (PgdA/CDA1 family)